VHPNPAKVQDPIEIEYLVNIKFPLYKVRHVSNSPAAKLEKVTEEAEKYKSQLENMPNEEVHALYKQAKNDVETKKLIKEVVDQRYFFNKPEAQADFEHWSKATYWTIEEAVALSLGKDPEKVNWKSMNVYQTICRPDFVKSFFRLYDLASRASNWQKLFNPTYPLLYTNWAKENDIELPEELVR